MTHIGDVFQQALAPLAEGDTPEARKVAAVLGSMRKLTRRQKEAGLPVRSDLSDLPSQRHFCPDCGDHLNYSPWDGSDPQLGYPTSCPNGHRFYEIASLLFRPETVPAR